MREARGDPPGCGRIRRHRPGSSRRRGGDLPRISSSAGVVTGKAPPHPPTRLLPTTSSRSNQLRRRGCRRPRARGSQLGRRGRARSRSDDVEAALQGPRCCRRTAGRRGGTSSASRRAPTSCRPCTSPPPRWPPASSRPTRPCWRVRTGGARDEDAVRRAVQGLAQPCTTGSWPPCPPPPWPTGAHGRWVARRRTTGLVNAGKKKTKEKKIKKDNVRQPLYQSWPTARARHGRARHAAALL